jgi:hypothetical protein
MSAAWLLCGVHSACVGRMDLSGAATQLGAPPSQASAGAGPSVIGCRGRFPRAVGGLIFVSSGWSKSIFCSRASRRSSCACSSSLLDDRGGSASMARRVGPGPQKLSQRPRGAGGEKADQACSPSARSGRPHWARRLYCNGRAATVRRTRRQTAPSVTEQVHRHRHAAPPGVEESRKPLNTAGLDRSPALVIRRACRRRRPQSRNARRAGEPAPAHRPGVERCWDTLCCWRTAGRARI